MQNRFEDQVVVVTGGAQGIGSAVVQRLADENASIVVADRQAEMAAKVVSGLGSSHARAMVIPVDISDEDCGRKLVSETVRSFGQINFAVLCAGVTAMKHWLHITPEEWDRMMTINLRGTFLCLQSIASQMINQGGGGAIVIMAATSGHGPRPDAAHYGASKAGIIHLTRSAALDLGRHGIRVNAISPAIVRTAMWSNVVDGRARLQGIPPEEYEGNAMNSIPLGRATTPEEVAALAAFLLSQEASSITGQIIFQDGGYSLVVP